MTFDKLSKALDIFANHGADDLTKSKFIVDGIDMNKKYPKGSEEDIMQGKIWKELEGV
jgi:hypothetical protein